MRTTLLWSAFAAAALLVAGCGPKQEGAGKGASLPKPAEAPAASGKVSLAVISPALTSVFHQEFVRGAEEAAKERGWEFSHLEPDRETNSADQVSKVQDSLQRGVSCISICAVNDEALVQSVKKANEAGVPIFVHNSITPVPAGKVEAYIGYDEFEGGRKCGQKAVQLLTAKHGSARGKVAILHGTAGTHTQQRAGGFKDALKGTQIEVVAEPTANWLRKEGADRTAELLQKHPDLDLVFGCSDAMAQGAAQAAKQAGRTLLTIGLDGNPDALADVKAGRLTATLVVFPHGMGRRAVEVIEQRLRGEKVGPVVKSETRVVDQATVDEVLGK